MSDIDAITQTAPLTGAPVFDAPLATQHRLHALDGGPDQHSHRRAPLADQQQPSARSEPEQPKQKPSVTDHRSNPQS